MIPRLRERRWRRRRRRVLLVGLGVRRRGRLRVGRLRRRYLVRPRRLIRRLRRLRLLLLLLLLLLLSLLAEEPLLLLRPPLPLGLLPLLFLLPLKGQLLGCRHARRR